MTQAPYTPPRSNGLGIAGFIVSLIAIFTFGLLSPIALLICFFALFKSPRGFAFTGLIISLIGTLFIGAVLFVFGWGILKVARFGKPMIATSMAVEEAHKKIDIYHATHGNTFPDIMTGNTLIAPDVDGWNHPLHYTPKGIGYELRSDGQDGVTGTEDDLARTFD